MFESLNAVATKAYIGVQIQLMSTKLLPMEYENGTRDGDKENWSLDNFLDNVITKGQSWGSLFTVIAGLVLVIVGIWKLVQGLTSGGKSQVSWPTVIIMLVLGGMLAFTGGWNLVKKITGGAGGTLEDMGKGSMIMPIF